MSARLIGRRLRAVRTSGDAGITLMELLVAMVLNVIVGTLAVSIFISVNDSTNNSVDRSVNTAAARNAVRDWTAYLRVADGRTAGVKTNRIEWLTANDMLFYADLYNRTVTNLAVTGAPTMLWLRRDSSGTLIEEQFAMTATAGTRPSVCRRMVGGVSAGSASAPIFSAIDKSGASMTGLDLGTAPASAAGCVPLPIVVPSQSGHPDLDAQANLQNVDIVQIDFVLRDSKGLHPIEFTSQAVLPALGGL
jgi:type II secretory pathway pseudopilin PulG